MKYCAQHGCNGLAMTGRFCAAHKESNYLKDRRALRPELDRWYKLASWAVVREYKLQRSPKCEVDDGTEFGCTSWATEVHHRDDSWKERGSWRDFIDQKNLQSLCKRHHSRITMLENRKRGAM